MKFRGKIQSGFISHVCISIKCCKCCPNHTRNAWFSRIFMILFFRLLHDYCANHINFGFLEKLRCSTLAWCNFWSRDITRLYHVTTLKSITNRYFQTKNWSHPQKSATFFFKDYQNYSSDYIFWCWFFRNVYMISSGKKPS